MDIKELTERAELAEQHARSVRQMHARHDRMLAAIDLVAARQESLRHGALARITHCIRHSVAQFHQETFALIHADGRDDGFFVEFGACDGRLISNTFILETLGWRGILAEPLPRWHAALRENRSCAVDTRCVWTRSGEQIKLGVPIGDDDGIEASVVRGDTFHETHEVETVSLNDLLEQHNAPPVIDFMSIDVEGGELEVLRSFDFSRCRFRFLAVETVHCDSARVNRLMQRKGYKPILSGRSGHDSIFVPADQQQLSITERFDRAHREIMEAVASDERIAYGWAKEQLRRRALPRCA